MITNNLKKMFLSALFLAVAQINAGFNFSPIFANFDGNTKAFGVTALACGILYCGAGIYNKSDKENGFYGNESGSFNDSNSTFQNVVKKTAFVGGMIYFTNKLASWLN